MSIHYTTAYILHHWDHALSTKVIANILSQQSNRTLSFSQWFSQEIKGLINSLRYSIYPPSLRPRPQICQFRTSLWTETCTPKVCQISEKVCEYQDKTCSVVFKSLSDSLPLPSLKVVGSFEMIRLSLLFRLPLIRKLRMDNWESKQTLAEKASRMSKI